MADPKRPTKRERARDDYSFSGGRLPLGGETADVDLYIREWRKVGRLICKLYGAGWRMTSFDPSITIFGPSPYSKATRSEHIDGVTFSVLARLAGYEPPVKTRRRHAR